MGRASKNKEHLDSVRPNGKPSGSLNSETLEARKMFFYGEGDGVRVVMPKELSEKSGVHEATIRKWLPVWREEHENVLRSTSKLACASILSLGDEVLAQNNADILKIRAHLDKISQELEDLPKISKTLLNLAEELAKSDDKELALTLLDKYFRTCANEQKLSKLYMDWKNMWDAKVGVDAVNSIQEAAAKAQAVAVARAPIETETELKPAVAGGVFRKSS